MKKLKKIVTVILTMLMMFACFNSSVYAESDERISMDIEYRISPSLTGDGTATLMSATNVGETGNSVIIPEEIDGYVITRIYEDAFHNGLTTQYQFKNLQYLTIPDTVTYIGPAAFSNLENIKECNIPKNIEYIEERAFASTPIKLTDYKFPSTLKEIGRRAFWNCGITGTLDLSETQVKEFGYECFADNSITYLKLPKEVIYVDGFARNNITEIDFPESVDGFRDLCFAGNPLFETLNIPEGTTSVGGAFGPCANLKYVNIPSSVTSIKDSFIGSGIIHGVIPDTVTNYGGNAFTGCVDMVSVKLPESNTILDYYEFANCESLVDVQLSSKLTFIRGDAFFNCRSLKTVDLPDTLTGISYDVFNSCVNLENLVIPKNVLSIDDGAFENTDLKSLTILNPSMEFKDVFGDTEAYPINESLIIYGYEGSTAQTFADERGIEFRVIGDDNPDPDTPPEIEEPDQEPDPDPEDPEEKEGFISQKDGWRIVNTKLGFGTQSSADEGFDLLNSALLAPFKKWQNTDLIQNAGDYINALLNDKNGRCFGMTSLAVAQYNGDVDLSTYFDRAGDGLNQFGYEDTIYFDSNSYPGYIYTLNGNTEVVNMIDKFQSLQRSPKLSQAEVYKDKNAFKQLLDDLYNSNERKPILVTFSARSVENGNLVSHAVVIETSKKPVYNPDTGNYFIECYDPNTPKIDDNLEGASSLYNDATPGFEINVNEDEYSYIWNNGDGYKNTLMTSRDSWGGLLKSINFYDLSILDDSFYEEEFQLDTDSLSQLIFAGKGISINDTNTKNVLFEADNLDDKKLGLYDENIECNPIYSDFDNDKLGFHFGMDTSGKTFLLQGENELISLYKERGVFIRSDGNINITFDNDNQNIKLISTSDDSQIEIMVSSRDGDKYVETDGSLNINQEIVIDLSDDDYSVKTDSDNIHSVYSENNEIINENFHNNLNSDYNNDSEHNNDNNNENPVAQLPDVSNDKNNYQLENSESKQSVKTGDNANLDVLSFLTIISAVTIGALFVCRKHRMSKNN